MKLLLLPFLVLASAFFSATETAVFALRRVDFAKWREEGNRKARDLERLIESPSRLIATIFVGNEIANVAIPALITGFVIAAFPAHGTLIATAVGTVGILVIDIAAKSLAWPRARTFSLFAVTPLRLFATAVRPVRFVLETAADGVLFLLGERGARDRGGVTEREFRALVDAGEETGTLDANESELIHNIFEMSDQRAGGIMTPLPDVFTVPVGATRDDLLRDLRRYRRSRIPVHDGERKNIVGVVHFKELLKAESVDGGPTGWTRLMNPPFVVPSSMRLSKLLRAFQRRKVHLAVVVDEFGDAVGIVTLEDVLEELFGEIREEHDREEREIVEKPDGTARVLGKTPIHRFNDHFGASLPDEEWDTVAGFVLHSFGALPERGTSVTEVGFTFTVQRLKGVRIVEVGVSRAPAVEIPNGDGGRG